jgi:mannose-6-phosphate isomerase-like protein (cupin superfamily)
LIALEASGTFKLTTEAGQEARSIEGGKVTMVPKGLQHEWVPGGTKSLLALQLYCPPGPEQRFRTLAGAGK